MALVLAALALTMTSAHVLELPQKMQWDASLYAAVNTTLYRYFAIVGGAYIVVAIVATCALAWLVRKRHPAFEWTVIAAVLFVLAFASWLVIVQPVNASIDRTLEASPDGVPAAWAHLRDRWEYGHVVGFVLQLLGLVALVVSTVVETAKEAPDVGMIHTTVSRFIRAPWQRVAAVYADHEGWPRVFPETIRGVRLVREYGADRTLEIDHVEGRVVNEMHVVARNEIVLAEWKRRYTARFTNRFDPAPGGTLYTLVADVKLRGPLQVLAPIAGPIVRSRMRRFVVDPLRDAVEHPGQHVVGRRVPA